MDISFKSKKDGLQMLCLKCMKSEILIEDYNAADFWEDIGEFLGEHSQC